MPNSELANERTPLTQSSADESLSGFDRVQRDFQETLEEEAPGTTFLDLLVNRPATTMVAFSLLALFFLIVTSIQSFRSPEFTNMAMRVVQFNPVHMRVLGIIPNEIMVETKTELKLDYSKFSNGSFYFSVACAIGNKLGHITVSLDGPLAVYSKPNVNDSEPEKWKYFISVRIQEQLNIKLEDGLAQKFTMTSSISDVGRTDLLAELVKQSLKNEPVVLMAKGTAVVSTYGLNFRIPFQYSRILTIPKQTSDEFAQISKVSIDTDGENRLKITALANSTVGEFPVSAMLPEFKWRVKIAGCEDNHGVLTNQDVCDGASLPFDLEEGDEDVNIYFQATLEKIPENLVTTCRAPSLRSPLDRFIESYLAGKLTAFYLEGIPDKSQPTILNDLLCGYDIPYKVFGKEATEKLIRSVQLKEVRFGNQHNKFHQKTVTFSGIALADVVLPQFMELKTTSAILVTGVRGTIQLFDSNRVHFGQILAHKIEDGEPDESFWLQTVSLANGEGYKISCFFDNLPMEVTDREALAGVSREMILRGHSAITYDAVVDVRVKSVIGEFAVRSVRIKGNTDMYA